MSLFLLNGYKLNFIEEMPFKLEKDIQNLCESNPAFVKLVVA